MTQRVFDVEDEKDMHALWHILPDDVVRVVKDESHGWAKNYCKFKRDDYSDNRSIEDINKNNRFEVEFCAGLEDKNGKLIYENDYVKYKENIYKVFWNKTKISLENILNNDIIDIQEFDYIEIIGNEHENGNIENV